ncbi:MAG: alpha/beta fold hydrolase [Xanthomonadales bacterium]|nr:alpha/beta fold hydrolase [Xanthomonadales bacterium]
MNNEVWKRLLDPVPLIAIMFALVIAVPTFAGEEPLHAVAPDAVEGVHAQDLNIASGDFDLATTILMPEGAGPFPGIVMLPGSGPHPRSHSSAFAEAFAKAGLAVISFDKRGSGESSGNWITSSIEDMAADGLAAMRTLAALPEVDSSRIGLWGPSQGAWIATIMHTMTPDIAFIVAMSGGGVTRRRSEEYSYSRALEQLGASPAEHERADAILDAYFDWLAFGEGRDDLMAMIDVVKDEPWYQALQIDSVLPSDKNRPNWEWVATYDPLPTIETMNFPVLLLFGENDDQQPTAEAAARWAEGLSKAGNVNVQTEIFTGADHMLMVGDPSQGHNRPRAERLFEIISAWLQVQTGIDTSSHWKYKTPTKLLEVQDTP